MKRYDIFFTCIWYRQSAAYTSLAPRGQVDGWTAKPSPLSIHGRLSEFSRIIYGGLKRWKIRITYRKWSSNFPRSERKPVYEKKNREVTYSVALVKAFLAAENENRQLEDLPQADLAVYLKDFLCRQGQSQWMRILWVENYAHCCFCNHDSTYFSIFFPMRFLFGNCHFLIFIL